MDELNKQIFVSEIAHLNIWCPLTELHYSDPETLTVSKLGCSHPVLEARIKPSFVSYGIDNLPALRDLPSRDVAMEDLLVVTQTCDRRIKKRKQNFKKRKQVTKAHGATQKINSFTGILIFPR